MDRLRPKGLAVSSKQFKIRSRQEEFDKLALLCRYYEALVAFDAQAETEPARELLQELFPAGIRREILHRWLTYNNFDHQMFYCYSVSLRRPFVTNEELVAAISMGKHVLGLFGTWNRQNALFATVE
ncbi:MAG: hypothetical protein ACHQUB_03105 [Candidatus Saccharimonadia bacterium]